MPATINVRYLTRYMLPNISYYQGIKPNMLGTYPIASIHETVIRTDDQ